MKSNFEEKINALTLSISFNITPNYTYSWSTGQSSNMEANLAAGTYDITVVSSLGCTTITQIVLTEPNQIQATPTIVNESIANNGSISVVASGGAAPYTYLWNTGDTNSSIDSLSAGNYSVTISDDHGCSETFNYTLKSTTGIHELCLSTFKLFPIPSFDGSFNLTWSHASNEVEVKVLDVLGKSIPFNSQMGTNSIYFNLGNAANGVYFVQIKDQSKWYTLTCVRN